MLLGARDVLPRWSSAALIGWRLGRDAAVAFLTGYVVEKSLSVDNLFVF